MNRHRNVPDPNMRSRQDVPEIMIAMQALSMLQHGYSVASVNRLNNEFPPQAIEHNLADNLVHELGHSESDSDDMTVEDNAIYGSKMSIDDNNDDTAIVENAIYGSRMSIGNDADDIETA